MEEEVGSKSLKPKEDHWEETRAYLETLPSKQLKKLVVGTRYDIVRMGTENLVFEAFLQENEPSLISGMEKTMEKLKTMQDHFLSCTTIKTTVSEQKLNDNHSTDSQAVSMMAKKLMSSKQSKGPRVNFSVKTDLTLREYDTLQMELKEFKEYAHRFKNKMKAEIEESGLRENEIKYAMSNFEQQIVIDAVEELTQKIPAEKFVRYMQEWLKASVFVLEKLRLRTNNLRTYLRKLKSLLTQKEELGETVTEADFELLSISNKNFIEKIEQKNINLLELKQINGNVNLTLTKHKNLLAKQELYTKSMEHQYVTVQKQLESLNINYYRTQKELEDDQKKHENIKNDMKKYKVPDVMEYIRKKHELADYRKRMKVWKRKVNIQNMVMVTYCSVMRQLTNSGKIEPEWFTKRKCSDDDDYLPEDLSLILKKPRITNDNTSNCSRSSSKSIARK